MSWFTEKKKIGLALQGGGSRGSYQIGAYYAFKKMGIHFDGICGTSIGAFNGIMLACGKEKELLTFWQNLSVGEILRFDPNYIKKKQEQVYDFSYFILAIKNLFHMVKSHGIPTEGLTEVIEKYVDSQTLMNSKMDFGLCTVRIKDLKPLYIFKEKMNPQKLADYVLASCYLPFFQMAKKIDDHYYLDGGFYDNTPINMLLDKNYKKIYVVELNPLINRHQKLKKEDIEIIKITPKRSLGGVLNFDQNSIQENIKMGYYDTLRVLKKLDGYYYCFKNIPECIYKRRTRKIARKEVNHVMGFFHAKTQKEVVIKTLEYIMKEEGFDYYQIYNPLKQIKILKKETTKQHFIYDFLKKL